MKFACIEFNTKSGNIWRPTPERPNYLCDPRREIDATSFGCWTSALDGEHIPLHWFIDGKSRGGVNSDATLSRRIKRKISRKLCGKRLKFKNIDYMKKFDVIAICHNIFFPDEMVQLLRAARKASPETIFLSTHGVYNLGRLRENWRNPEWFSGLKEFFDMSDIVLAVNRKGVDYLQLATSTPVVYFPPFYPYEYTKGHFVSTEKKEKIIFIAGDTSRIDNMLSVFVAKEIEKKHPDFTISLQRWPNMNLAPLEGSKYETLPLLEWQEYLELTGKSYLMLNFDFWWTNGRVAKDAAAVGTPCVGGNADSQMELFPDLVCEDVAGVKTAIKLGSKLIDDTEWYQEMQNKASRKLEAYSYENSKKRFEKMIDCFKRRKMDDWHEEQKT